MVSSRLEHATQLASAELTAKTILDIDDVVVRACFATADGDAEDAENVMHVPKTMAISPPMDASLLKSIRTLHKAVEWHDLSNALFMREVRLMVKKLRVEYPSFLPDGHHLDVARWCFAAYTSVMRSASPVRLITCAMGPERTNQFAVVASAPIPGGVTVYEMLGLMAINDDCPHTNLSVMLPDPMQTGHQGPRIMIGPLRFVNHICEGANAEIIALQHTSAFYLRTLRAIEVGEEILVDYGKGYFDDEECCPCAACSAHTSRSS
ncbi:hypothetical protein PLICRDRAFT_43942 [Plicaturopsis crispa FD-325 SS-3]|nr:hypothetical protein PLICRDRAFT_43942 [Plicaturopsis crispa FD-325 SS-3]